MLTCQTIFDTLHQASATEQQQDEQLSTSNKSPNFNPVGAHHCITERVMLTPLLGVFTRKKDPGKSDPLQSETRGEDGNLLEV